MWGILQRHRQQTNSDLQTKTQINSNFHNKLLQVTLLINVKLRHWQHFQWPTYQQCLPAVHVDKLANALNVLCEVWIMMFPQRLPSFKLIEFRDRPELSSFSRMYNAYAGREGGSRAAVRFKKKSFTVHCDLQKGSQNQHFQCTLLVGREVTKKYCVC